MVGINQIDLVGFLRVLSVFVYQIACYGFLIDWIVVDWFLLQLSNRLLARQCSCYSSSYCTAYSRAIYAVAYLASEATVSLNRNVA